MSTSAKKTQTPAKSARGASVSRKLVYTIHGRDSQSGAQGASVSMLVTRPKSTPSTRNKSATRKVARPAELEDDAFDRAIAKASKSGLLDEMIAEALQDQRDGKTTPL